MKKNAYEFYKPIIVKDIKVDWITGETIPSGETWIMITKKFISSLEENFYTYSTNMLSLFIWGNIWDHLNRILIIIKEDNTAKIYRKFPMSVWIIAKQDIKAGSLIWKRQIADIESIEFNDSEYEIEIEQWDKIIWLFRIDWRFWLYFDFSKTLNPTNLSKELGSCYRSLAYYNLYSFLDDKDNFDFLLQDWWFPFIQINDERFERLIQYYKEEKKYELHVNELIEWFNKEKIEAIVRYWWQNPVLNSKKNIIEAGIGEYFKDINCIKNLSSEIEWIIRYACFNEKWEKDPKVKDLKEYITDKGVSKFSSIGSLGFPKLFYDYLTEVVFKKFDIEKEIPTSRHSVAHWIAKFENYTKIRAFQMILIIDQIYFFLRK